MFSRCAVGFSIALTLWVARAAADPVAVRKMEGVVHGFLVLRSEGGEVLAEGDLIQVPRQRGIDSRLTFRFRDGSVHDERLYFTQEGVFRLESYHLLQKGPSFPQSIEVTLNRAESRFEVRHTKDGESEEEVLEGTLELPDDAYNGMFFTLLKNIDGTPRTVSLVAFTPEPRMVNLEVTSLGEEKFAIEKTSRRATRYALDIDVTGFTGLLAKLFGKDPAPLHTWMLGGDAPTFVKFEGFLYQGGPTWTIELTSPTWSAATDAADSRR